MLQVVFIHPAKTKEEFKRLAAKVKPLQVNGQNVLRWARWMVKNKLTVPANCGDEVEVLFDEGAAKEYEGLDGVPEVILASAVYPETAEVADTVLETFLKGREGYARARHGSVEDGAAGGAGETDIDDGIEDYEMMVCATSPAMWCRCPSWWLEPLPCRFYHLDIRHPRPIPLCLDSAQTETAPTYQADERVHDIAQQFKNFQEILRRAGRLVLSRGESLLSDYDPRFFAYIHPWTFPHGTGADAASPSFSLV